MQIVMICIWDNNDLLCSKYWINDNYQHNTY